MKISIFGLGYVGSMLCEVLSDKHDIIGVDIDEEKVKNAKVEATTDLKKAIIETDTSIICVGTPENIDGSVNLNYINNVFEDISEVLKIKKKHHTFIIRSTIPAGTTELMIKKYLTSLDVSVSYNPEFFREATAVKDFLNPPFIIYAATDKKAEKAVKELHKGIDAEIIKIDFKEAESMKMICNVFHALKVVFANEIGRFCKAYSLDGMRIMEVFCKDKQLNISPYYLKPTGKPYGGHCLPKDLRSFIDLSKKKKLDLPVLFNVETSNEKCVREKK